MRASSPVGNTGHFGREKQFAVNMYGRKNGWSRYDKVSFELRFEMIEEKAEIGGVSPLFRVGNVPATLEFYRESWRSIMTICLGLR